MYVDINTIINPIINLQVHCSFLLLYRGSTFTGTYRKVSQVHSIMPEGANILALSATVTHRHFEDLWKVLSLGDDMSVICNLPNRYGIM